MILTMFLINYPSIHFSLYNLNRIALPSDLLQLSWRSSNNSHFDTERAERCNAGFHYENNHRIYLSSCISPKKSERGITVEMLLMDNAQ